MDVNAKCVYDCKMWTSNKKIGWGWEVHVTSSEISKVKINIAKIVLHFKISSSSRSSNSNKLNINRLKATQLATIFFLFFDCIIAWRSQYGQYAHTSHREHGEHTEWSKRCVQIKQTISNGSEGDWERGNRGEKGGSE